MPVRLNTKCSTLPRWLITLHVTWLCMLYIGATACDAIIHRNQWHIKIHFGMATKNCVQMSAILESYLPLHLDSVWVWICLAEVTLKINVIAVTPYPKCIILCIWRGMELGGGRHAFLCRMIWMRYWFVPTIAYTIAAASANLVYSRYMLPMQNQSKFSAHINWTILSLRILVWTRAL